MKTKSIYQGIALLTMALTTTAACQNELNEGNTEPQPGQAVNMTIRATQSMGPQTRTSYEDKLGGGTAGNIVVKWEGGKEAAAPVETIKVFGYSDNTTPPLDYSVDFTSTPGSLSTDGASITFTGIIDTKPNYLAMYPADKCNYDADNGVVYTTFTGQTQDCTSPMAHLKGFDFMVGKPATAGSHADFDFTHEATMIRFVLDLPSEAITKVSLSATGKKLYSRMMTYVTSGTTFDASVADENPETSLDLDIINHTPSANPLKAYMMVPTLNLSGATLTVTVTTAIGKTYEGKLQVEANTELQPGLCYTLTPTLTSPNTITVPPVTEGKLQEELDKIDTSDPAKTELALTGTVDQTDINNLASFLKDDTKSGNITSLDLSGITLVNNAPVAGFKECAKVTTVILPTGAEAIGDNAFEGCSALTTILQKETAVNTRGSMPKGVKIVGANAFKDCTSMTTMFLHTKITSVGDNAFDGCTVLTSLVFEGTKSIGSDGITLGTGIVNNTHANLKILLPAIATEALAASYNEAIGKKIPTHYDFFIENVDYNKATEDQKTDAASYKSIVINGSNGNLDGFKPGGALEGK